MDSELLSLRMTAFFVKALVYLVNGRPIAANEQALIKEGEKIAAEFDKKIAQRKEGIKNHKKFYGYQTEPPRPENP